ncbi:MAG: alanine/ornithine racemase family PLP-dependent enzyme [Christensenellales bacterium]
MDAPRLDIDLTKIKNNAKTIVELCNKRGIDVVGVTKGVSGMPEVGKAMLEGGVCALADARMRNIIKLRKSGITSEIMMLRLPRISSVKAIVKHTDLSFNSEINMIRSLADKSRALSASHRIILMTDIGDLREGIMYTQVMHIIKRILSLKGIELCGIGTNVGCYGGVLPSEENMGLLAKIVRDIRYKYSIPIPVVSIGGTNCLSLISNGNMPKEINQIRVGEGILLGRDSAHNAIIDGTSQDAFKLAADIVEIKNKPSMPIGSIGKDAFGNTPKFKDKGVRRKALIALGKQDARLSGLLPIDKKIKILGGSSDYIIIDINDSDFDYALGDEIHFHLLYPGLLSVSTSPFVGHHFPEDIYNENQCPASTI